MKKLFQTLNQNQRLIARRPLVEFQFNDQR